MTWIEMWKEDYPSGDTKALIEGNCPDECYLYATRPAYCDNGGDITKCFACWSREINDTPQEAPEAAENALKVMLDPGAKMPTRAHELDAGYDLYSPVDACVFCKARGVDNTIVIDTGVHMQIPPGYVGDIEPKSGMMVNHSILTDGTIDAGYTGSIRVKLFNFGKSAFHIKQGQKIAQIVIKKIITPRLEVVETLEETDRGDNGFGSSGKF